jgi:EAL domain-containing protein (putative c-di-GMP-specific phosphodiesterase class I)
VFSPGDFIPIAEKRGMMSDIGRWVIDRSCCQLNQWRNTGYDFTGHLAVNVAAAQLENEKVLQHILSSMERHQIAPGTIQVEITESSMKNAGRTALAT